MSKRSARRPQRPSLASEQMGQVLKGGLLGVPKIDGRLSRQQAMILAVGFVTNLARMWNGPDSPPFASATVEKRTNGVSLHIEMLDGTDESDAVPG